MRGKLFFKYRSKHTNPGQGQMNLSHTKEVIVYSGFDLFQIMIIELLKWIFQINTKEKFYTSYS